MADGVLDERETQETLVLAEARSAFERQAINAWAATHHPGAVVTDAADAELDRLPPDTQLIPVRVVWLPPVRHGERRVWLQTCWR